METLTSLQFSCSFGEGPQNKGNNAVALESLGLLTLLPTTCREWHNGVCVRRASSEHLAQGSKEHWKSSDRTGFHDALSFNKVNNKRQNAIAALEQKYQAIERENAKLEASLYQDKSRVASVNSLESEYVALTEENAMLEARLIANPRTSIAQQAMSPNAASMLADSYATNDLNTLATDTQQSSGLTATMDPGKAFFAAP